MFDFLKYMHIIQDDENELKAYLEQSATLIDVRTAEEFAMGSLEGAINIPMDQIPARYKEIDKDRPSIVFCRSGNRSDNVKRYLKSLGYDHIKNGGAWQVLDKLVKQNS